MTAIVTARRAIPPAATVRPALGATLTGSKKRVLALPKRQSFHVAKITGRTAANPVGDDGRRTAGRIAAATYIHVKDDRESAEDEFGGACAKAARRHAGPAEKLIIPLRCRSIHARRSAATEDSHVGKTASSRSRSHNLTASRKAPNRERNHSEMSITKISDEF